MTESIIDFIRELNPFWVYIFLVFSTFTENVFPPWPGDTFIVFSGFLMYHQILDPFWVYFFTTIGNFLGAFLMYFLGQTILEFAHRIHKKVKIELLKNLLETMISEEQKIKTERIFEKWGFWFVLISRFSAGIRYFVSIIAGITKMNLSIFSFAFFVAVIVWNSLLFFGGYILAENWKKALEWLRVYNFTIGILILIVVLLIFYKFLIKKKDL